MPPRESRRRRSSRSSNSTKASPSGPSGVQKRQWGVPDRSPNNRHRIRTEIDFGDSLSRGDSTDLVETYAALVNHNPEAGPMRSPVGSPVRSDDESWTSKWVQSDDEDEGDNSGPIDLYSSHDLDSPPPSPGLLQPDSPKTREEVAEESEACKSELEELMRDDEEFRESMASWSGCKIWWTQNAEEWRRRRQEIHEMDEEIAYLESLAREPPREESAFGETEEGFEEYRPARAGWRTNNRQPSKHVVDERLLGQIETLKQQRKDCLPWFEENRNLMKIIWHHFKEIMDQIRSEEMEQLLRYPDIREYHQVDDIRRLSAYKDPYKGIESWFVHTNHDLAQFEQALAVHQTDDEDLTTQCLKSLDEYRQIQKWMIDQINDEDREADTELYSILAARQEGFEVQIRQIMTRRYADKKKQVQDDFNITATITELEQKVEEAKTIRKYQHDLAERNSTFSHLIERISDPHFGPAHDSESPYSAKIFTEVYNLISLHIKRTRRVLKILIHFRTESDTFTHTKRGALIKVLEKYSLKIQFENFRSFFEQRLRPGAQPFSYDDLREAVVRTNREYYNLLEPEVLKPCDKLFSAHEKLPQDFGPSNTTRYSYIAPDANTVVFTQETPVYRPNDRSRTLGSNVSLGIARDRLESFPTQTLPSPYAPDIVPWDELLRQFFTSPDVFPHFRNPTDGSKTRSWTRKEFAEKVDSLLHTPLAAQIREAFLVFCTHTNDLFRVSEFRRRVEPIASGWELCEENLWIAGLYRKVDPRDIARPRDIDVAENWMRNNGRYFGMEVKERKFNENWLRDALNRHIPPEKHISRRRMREYLLYWGAVGNFFVMVDPSANYEEDEAPLIRIDAGFVIPPDAPRLPIEKPDSRIYRRIRDIWSERIDVEPSIQRKLRRGEKIYERNLYRALFLDGKEVGMNWEISRHQFRLFLRWCSQRDGMSFKLLRGGEVRFLSNNRGPSNSGPSSNGRPSRSGQNSRNEMQRSQSQRTQGSQQSRSSSRASREVPHHSENTMNSRF